MKSTLLALMMVGVSATAMAQNFSDYFTVKYDGKELQSGDAIVCTNGEEQIPGMGLVYDANIQVISKEADGRAVFGVLNYTGKPSQSEVNANPTLWGTPSLCFEGADNVEGSPTQGCLPSGSANGGEGTVWIPEAGRDSFIWQTHVTFASPESTSTYRLLMVAMDGLTNDELEETGATFTLDITFTKTGSGVDSIAADGEGEGVCYDLQGRRVLNPVKGLYIRDGKKVIVK